jgi:uncharacterized protein DUF3592
MMTSLIITFVSLAFTGAILFVVFYMVYVKIIKPSQQSKKLLQTGLPAKAKVLSIIDTGVTVNENPQAQLTLEVTPQSGMSPYQAVTRMIISRLQIPQFQPGAKLLVKYDPNNPMMVAIEGIEQA